MGGDSVGTEGRGIDRHFVNGCLGIQIVVGTDARAPRANTQRTSRTKETVSGDNAGVGGISHTVNIENHLAVSLVAHADEVMPIAVRPYSGGDQAGARVPL